MEENVNILDKIKLLLNDINDNFNEGGIITKTFLKHYDILNDDIKQLLLNNSNNYELIKLEINYIYCNFLCRINKYNNIDIILEDIPKLEENPINNKILKWLYNIKFFDYIFYKNQKEYLELLSIIKDNKHINEIDLSNITFNINPTLFYDFLEFMNKIGENINENDLKIIWSRNIKIYKSNKIYINKLHEFLKKYYYVEYNNFINNKLIEYLDDNNLQLYLSHQYFIAKLFYIKYINNFLFQDNTWYEYKDKNWIKINKLILISFIKKSTIFIVNYLINVVDNNNHKIFLNDVLLTINNEKYTKLDFIINNYLQHLFFKNNIIINKCSKIDLYKSFSYELIPFSKIYNNENFMELHNFLNLILSKKNLNIILKLLSKCLFEEIIVNKLVVFYGDLDSGKDIFLKLIKHTFEDLCEEKGFNSKCKICYFYNYSYKNLNKIKENNTKLYITNNNNYNNINNINDIVIINFTRKIIEEKYSIEKIISWNKYFLSYLINYYNNLTCI
jgi:hypothetical protein